VCSSDLEPAHGYYQNHDPFGQHGDFITAPEISQMFGELIGVWCIGAWKALGEPASFNLIELGPGRGILMSDLLRAAKSVPKFAAGVRVGLVETSEKLRAIQREKLAEICAEPKWLDQISDIPERPTIVIANEFLDVIPFRQYVKQDGNWRERVIGCDEDGSLSFFTGSGTIDKSMLPAGFESEPDGSVFEYAPAREAMVQILAEMIAATEGCALFIDYGHLKSGFGDTFQAVKAHAFADPLDDPGGLDLTSHVDFGPLVSVARSCANRVFQIKTQAEFLLDLGLLERAGALGRNLSPKQQEDLTQTVERLAAPEQMGELFKCFSFSSSDDDIAPFQIGD